MVKIKLKREYLWWRANTVLTEKDVPLHHMHEYVKDNHAEYVEEEEKKIETKEVKDKLEDVKKDLADDGKRNYSHDPKRKSPGRKPKKKKSFFGGKK